jgi:hypothetical protein
LKNTLLLILISFVFRCLRRTWRIDEEAFPEQSELARTLGHPIIFAHWHGDEWPLVGTFAGRPMAVLVSESQDGSLMTSFLKGLGFTVVRGSSSKGAVRGFLGLVRTVKRKKVPLVSLAVDGPRGPRHEPKDGVFALAKAFKGGIVVGSMASSNSWVFSKSWSQAEVPKFFSKIVVRYEYLSPDSLGWGAELPSIEVGENDSDNQVLGPDRMNLLKNAFKEGFSRAKSDLKAD